MRTRSIIQRMEEGDPEAFEKAELKLSQSDVHEANKEALANALARLKDPRTS